MEDQKNQVEAEGQKEQPKLPYEAPRVESVRLTQEAAEALT